MTTGTPHIDGMLARLNPHLPSQDTEAQQVILNQMLGLQLLCHWAPAVTLSSGSGLRTLQLNFQLLLVSEVSPATL